MSTPWPDLAIAAVTRALKDRLQRALDASDINGQVRTDKPDKVSDVTGPVINLYLYQTAINPFMRNDDILPEVVRVGVGGAVQLVRVWQVPLSLHYLLSFYGDEQKQEPQRLLAVAIAVLHRYPTIAADAVRRSALVGFPQLAPEAASEVADITLTIADFGLDDIYRLWSVFKGAFALSLGCLAETVVAQSAPREDEGWLVEALDLRVAQDSAMRGVSVELTNAGPQSLRLASASALSGHWEAGRDPVDSPVIAAWGGHAVWRVRADDAAQAPAGRVELVRDGGGTLLFQFDSLASGTASCTVEGAAAEVRRANPDDLAYPVFLVRLVDSGA